MKDFIRAQVERRWNPGGKLSKGADWIVAVHIVLGPDGDVRRADIVGDPRHSTDDAWQDFARSARNAVLLSSPLIVSADDYDIAKDIVVDFDAREVLR